MVGKKLLSIGGKDTTTARPPPPPSTPPPPPPPPSTPPPPPPPPQYPSVEELQMQIKNKKGWEDRASLLVYNRLREFVVNELRMMKEPSIEIDLYLEETTPQGHMMSAAERIVRELQACGYIVSMLTAWEGRNVAVSLIVRLPNGSGIFPEESASGTI